MKSKKKESIILMTSIILFLIGYAIVYPENMGICDRNNDACIYSMPTFTIGEPLLFGSISLVVVSIFLFFTNKKSFDIWKKFSIIYLPIAIILILITPVTSGGLININKELTTMWLAGIFFVVSLGIIFGKRDHHSPLDLDEC
ncbi:MAG: hypothetical protein OEV93_00975 [Candidatus Moranbacteria bacterium]|nr:hypothetical protein [Candidatus Moranbacteria bacterium]